jgi:hypothetical protein
MTEVLGINAARTDGRKGTERRNNADDQGVEFGSTGVGRQMRGEECYCIAQEVILTGTGDDNYN